MKEQFIQTHLNSLSKIDACLAHFGLNTVGPRTEKEQQIRELSYKQLREYVEGLQK